MAPTGKDSAGDNIDIANLTVTQLKAACKKLKLPNYTLNEAELISMLQEYRELTGNGLTSAAIDISGLTKNELKEECKRCGLRNYAKLNKAGLISLLQEDMERTGKGLTSAVVDISGLTKEELKAECKRCGLHNQSKLNKAGLISLLQGLSNDDVEVARGTVFQEMRPGAGFKTGDFVREKLGGAIVERHESRLATSPKVV